MQTFELNNIKITEQNNGVVSIQLYNVAGFEQSISVASGVTLGLGDNRLYYYHSKQLITFGNVPNSNDRFCLRSIFMKDNEFESTFDFVVDNVKQFFNGENRFISAIINKVIYDNLMKGK